MPSRSKALSKNPPKHAPLHALLTERCPELSATRPSDIDFAIVCAALAPAVPEKHRENVLAAFELGIETQNKHDSDGARSIARSLNQARQVLKRLRYDAAHAGNGVDLSRASAFAHERASTEQHID